jgi:hypothetical protein
MSLREVVLSTNMARENCFAYDYDRRKLFSSLMWRRKVVSSMNVSAESCFIQNMGWESCSFSWMWPQSVVLSWLSLREVVLFMDMPAGSCFVDERGSGMLFSFRTWQHRDVLLSNLVKGNRVPWLQPLRHKRYVCKRTGWINIWGFKWEKL